LARSKSLQRIERGLIYWKVINMAGKEVRRTIWQDSEGKVYPIVTHRYSRRIFSGEYEVRAVHVATRSQRGPSHEVAASGRFKTANDAERTAINKLEDRQERVRHY
jgi:hypothetical protein